MNLIYTERSKTVKTISARLTFSGDPAKLVQCRPTFEAGRPNMFSVSCFRLFAFTYALMLMVSASHFTGLSSWFMIVLSVYTIK